jgi:ribonuclease HII
LPDFKLERSLGGIVAGIDEAGRGPLAGPVVAAAVILGNGEGPARRLPPLLRHWLDDSKRVPPVRRQMLYEALLDAAQANRICYGLGAASVGEIDRFNILAATHLAMARALAALRLVPDIALVDGNRAPPLPCRVETIVGGDGLSLSIAAASILAKVTRDRLMQRLASRFPGFGWEHNMGYGTDEHRAALERLGPTRHHRHSFAPLRPVQGELSL